MNRVNSATSTLVTPGGLYRTNFCKTPAKRKKKIEQEQISSEMQTFDGDKLSLT